MTFISDCYQFLYSRVFNTPSRFGWVIDGNLAASGRLMTIAQLECVIKKGIKSVITIRESALNPAWFPDCSSVNYKHVQVEDHGAPSVAELDDVVNYINGEIENSKPVLVHCNGGSGRTGTIVAAYLMKKEGLSAEQAAMRLKEIRGRTLRHKKQLDVLIQYENYLTNE